MVELCFIDGYGQFECKIITIIIIILKREPE